MVADITGNPKGFRFRKLGAASLPRVLDQVDLAVINTNYALDAKLSPCKDALASEGGDSLYVNYLVTRADDRDDPLIEALAAALTSQPFKDSITRTYEGAVIPAK